jgi:uncharacterized protein (TIGR03089 family)
VLDVGVHGPHHAGSRRTSVARVNATATTLPALLQARLAADPGRPLVTFYDDATGERTELSVKTWANWVAKVANLLTDELMLDAGDSVRVDLPPHWLGTVFLGATLACGVRIGDGDVAVVGPGGLADPAGTVVACSLHPFATPFAEPLPPGVLDFGRLWPGQSDVLAAVAPSEVHAVADDRRVITDLDPLSSEGRGLFLGLLAGSGSLVLVANADEGRWPAHTQDERATATVRRDQPSR